MEDQLRQSKEERFGYASHQVPYSLFSALLLTRALYYYGIIKEVRKQGAILDAFLVMPERGVCLVHPVLPSVWIK